MIDRAGRPHFPLEPGHHPVVPDTIPREDLQGHDAAELGVHSFVDRAHAPFAKFLQQFVLAELSYPRPGARGLLGDIGPRADGWPGRGSERDGGDARRQGSSARGRGRGFRGLRSRRRRRFRRHRPGFENQTQVAIVAGLLLHRQQTCLGGRYLRDQFLHQRGLTAGCQRAKVDRPLLHRPLDYRAILLEQRQAEKSIVVGRLFFRRDSQPLLIGIECSRQRSPLEKASRPSD